LATAVQNSLTPLSRTEKILAWLPTLAWLGVIASFSTDTFSASHTGIVLWRFVHIFYPTISVEHFQMLHFGIRKTAHFTVYAILSLVAFRSWRATLPSNVPWRFLWSGLALLLALIAASSDEFHQGFVPSRARSSQDVLLDMMGAMFMQIVVASFTRFSAGRVRQTN
jgi:VanZ family protein